MDFLLLFLLFLGRTGFDFLPVKLNEKIGQYANKA
jgi:hypothetical protein